MKIADGIQLINHPALNANAPMRWADLGCGTGFFTNVLSSLLYPGSTIYAVDSDAASLKKVQVNAQIQLETFAFDFVKQPLLFAKLDGILMANALHYVKDKHAFLQKAKQHLVPGGALLFVEYDTDKANPWVPYPIKFAALKDLCLAHNFTTVEKIHEIPSAFGRSMLYGAIARG